MQIGVVVTDSVLVLATLALILVTIVEIYAFSIRYDLNSRTSLQMHGALIVMMSIFAVANLPHSIILIDVALRQKNDIFYYSPTTMLLTGAASTCLFTGVELMRLLTLMERNYALIYSNATSLKRKRRLTFVAFIFALLIATVQAPTLLFDADFKTFRQECAAFACYIGRIGVLSGEISWLTAMVLNGLAYLFITVQLLRKRGGIAAFPMPIIAQAARARAQCDSHTVLLAHAAIYALSMLIPVVNSTFLDQHALLSPLPRAVYSVGLTATALAYIVCQKNFRRGVRHVVDDVGDVHRFLTKTYH